MLFYRIKNNQIIDYADYKYSDDCLETEKNIVLDFNGKAIFEEETQTQEYIIEKEQFNEQLNKEQKISELKQHLADTDYIAIKFAEGEISTEEYEPTKLQRKAWRQQINELEK